MPGNRGASLARRDAARLHRVPVGLWLCVALLAACDSAVPGFGGDPRVRAPDSASTPWNLEAAGRIPGGKATVDAFTGRVQPVADITPDRTRAYDLPALIDLAQRLNPMTRVQWQAACAAAARVGIAEGAYLPTLSAVAMASDGQLPGYDKTGPFLVRTAVAEPLL